MASPQSRGRKPRHCAFRPAAGRWGNFMLTVKNSSKHAGLLLALFLGTTLLWAGDKPWKSKPYKQWDNKDLQAIFTDSPWVQITTIQRTWLPVSEKNVAPPPEIAGGVQRFPRATGTSSGAIDRASETSWRELKVYVYWDSSRVM